MEQREPELGEGWRGQFTPHQRRFAPLLVLPSGLQLRVLGECSRAGAAWGEAEGPGVAAAGATCGCSETPTGRGCFWAWWGLGWAHV